MRKDSKHAMRATIPALTTDNTAPSIPAETALLSPQRAFVVQFRLGSGQNSVHFDGRVEHVVSGNTARFHTPQELLAFIARVLDIGRAPPSKEP